MSSPYKADPWRIIEEEYIPEQQEASESIFSLGNGHMGQRANFEERYSGETLQGNYLAGVYYPDKTRVGWWKNGYPDYFAKVLNAPNWIGIDVELDDRQLDIHICRPISFRRELNMQYGYLERYFSVEIGGKKLEIAVRRFLSLKRDEMGCIRYSVRSVDFSGRISFRPYIDGNVVNRDSNYNEHFWEMVKTGASKGSGFLMARTRKTGFFTCMTMGYDIRLNEIEQQPDPEVIEKKDFVANKCRIEVVSGDKVEFRKYVSVLTSLNSEPLTMIKRGEELLQESMDAGYESLFNEHIREWEKKWDRSDIVIKGDIEAQQAIRFNIFQLNQTYTGKDDRLNIGPKGFTGEKYGGGTYWDTEAYMVPFFLSSAPESVAKNLLVYRYRHLGKAIENAEKLGFTGGAALYPMVTMNGEECHNEWEITFEEIHRNGAIAFAVYNYIRYTGDREYLALFGLEVLISIARFWKQRVNRSGVSGKYVILGVTGPNEYENNVNNNWYTNKIAHWTLSYTLEALDIVKEINPEEYDRILEKTGFNFEEETGAWRDILGNLHFHFNEELGIFMQQDGYMDKEQLTAGDLDPGQRPINQHWSWDRILRSCLIKQADVLQGLFLFEEEYDKDTIRRNFDFYEPRTVHESSLSPCVHSILASGLGRSEKAYKLFLMTARLDLDDYNNEVKEGLHITSMGGTWMSVVYGFGGMRIKDSMLSFEPRIPVNWKGLSFMVLFRGRTLKVSIEKNRINIENLDGERLEIYLLGDKKLLDAGGSVVAEI